MKRIIAALLVLILFVSMCTLTAYAEPNGKIDGKLAEKLDSMEDDDYVNVWIEINSKSGYFYSYAKNEELKKQAYEICGFTYGDNLTQEQEETVNEMRLRLWTVHRHQTVIDLFEKMGVDASDVVGGWDKDDVNEGWKQAFFISKERILAIAELAEIASIDLNESDYYLIGTMNKWEINNSYRFTHIGDGVYTVSGLAIKTGDTFKVAVSDDGLTYNENACYPLDGVVYNANSEIIHYDSAAYTFDFRPDGLGKEAEGWYQGTILAYSAESAVDDTTKYRTRLDEWLKEKYGETAFLELSEYEELYEHKTADGTADWVMLNAKGGAMATWYAMGIIGNRVIVSGSWQFFEFGMALYDAQADTFYDLSKMKDYSTYSGLADALDGYGKGKLLGDLDEDDEISSIDVTMILRCQVQVRNYPESDWIEDSDLVNDYYKPIHYYSDFNRDGERDIIDATCIQRYLVGISYPIGQQ